MQNNLPKRRAWVDFEIKNPTETGENAKRIEGLNIRFSVAKFRGQVQGRAKISICNLAPQDVAYLTTYMSPWIEIQKQKKIQLFAGYEGKTGLLFSGDILKALPTQPPDVWLDCEALGGYFNNLKTESFTIAGPISIKQVAQQLAVRQDLNFMCVAKEETASRQIDGFCYTGGLTHSVKKINDLGIGCCWVEDDTLYLGDSEPELTDTVNVRVVDETSGLVGIPVPGPVGVDFTMLLDPSIKLGDPIELRSKRIPTINGIYWPYSVEHTGELRGNDWYTKVKCQRFKYA